MPLIRLNHDGIFFLIFSLTNGRTGGLGFRMFVLLLGWNMEFIFVFTRLCTSVNAIRQCNNTIKDSAFYCRLNQTYELTSDEVVEKCCKPKKEMR